MNPAKPKPKLLRCRQGQSMNTFTEYETWTSFEPTWIHGPNLQIEPASRPARFLLCFFSALVLALEIAIKKSQLKFIEREEWVIKQKKSAMGESNTSADEDFLLKEFFAEVSEVERENEVIRFSLFFFFYWELLFVFFSC